MFGNGERTGNVCLITLALNLFTQGIDPELDMSDIDHLRDVVEHCNELPVHQRHPYAGELVHSAFSGSHQDAIKKGIAAMEGSNSGRWEVPYLPIDPADIGRTYEAIIRVNSQSGKGGVASILQTDYQLDLPRALQVEFSRSVQEVTDTSGKEITSAEIWSLFERQYLEAKTPYEYLEHWSVPDTHASGRRRITANIREHGAERTIEGRGNGPIAAFVEGFKAGNRNRRAGSRLPRARYRPRGRCHRGGLRGNGGRRRCVSIRSGRSAEHYRCFVARPHVRRESPSRQTRRGFAPVRLSPLKST